MPVTQFRRLSTALVVAAALVLCAPSAQTLYLAFKHDLPYEVTQAAQELRIALPISVESADSFGDGGTITLTIGRTHDPLVLSLGGTPPRFITVNGHFRANPDSRPALYEGATHPNHPRALEIPRGDPRLPLLRVTRAGSPSLMNQAPFRLVM